MAVDAVATALAAERLRTVRLVALLRFTGGRRD